MDKSEKIEAIKAAVARRAAEAKRKEELARVEAARKKAAESRAAHKRNRAKDERKYVTMDGATEDDIKKILAMKEAAITAEERSLIEAKESFTLASKRYYDFKEAGFPNPDVKKNLRRVMDYLDRKVRLHEKLLQKAKDKEYRLPKRYVPKYQSVPKEDFLAAQKEQNAMGYFSIEQTCVNHGLSRQAVSHRVSLGLINPHVVGQYKFISHKEMVAATEEIKRRRSDMAMSLKKSVAD